jgi:hypothetical protein
MFPEHIELLIASLAAGAALALTGLGNLIAGRLPPRARAAGALVVCGVVLAAVGAWAGSAALVLTTGLLMAAVLVPFALAASPRCRAAGAKLAGWLARPGPRAGLLAAAGVAVVVAGVARYEAVDAWLHEENMRALDIAGGPLSHVPVGNQVEARTDKGVVVLVGLPAEARGTGETDSIEANYLKRSSHAPNLLRREPAYDHSNCHGWVFTGGRYLVPGKTVEIILADNGYRPVAVPQPGDLAVYRDSNGISHTAVVRYVTDGMPVLVEGKWGRLGVFLHAVDKSCYGTDYAFYRSARPGHLLAGMAPPSGPRSRVSPGG